MAIIDIVGILRGRREQRQFGIEELAAKLAGGVDVPPEEVEAALDLAGCTAEELQDRLVAIDRRADLLKRVAAGTAALAKLDKIDAVVSAAFDLALEKQKAHFALREKHADEAAALRQAIDLGEAAAGDLLDPKNLSPADREKLAAARGALDAATKALFDSQRRLPELKTSLAEAEAGQAEAAETARMSRGDATAKQRATEATNAVAARGLRLRTLVAELPGLASAHKTAETALSRVEDALRQ